MLNDDVTSVGVPSLWATRQITLCEPAEMFAGIVTLKSAWAVTKSGEPLSSSMKIWKTTLSCTGAGVGVGAGAVEEPASATITGPASGAALDVELELLDVVLELLDVIVELLDVLSELLD